MYVVAFPASFPDKKMVLLMSIVFQSALYLFLDTIPSRPI